MKKIFTIILTFIISFASYALNFSVFPTGFISNLKETTTHEVTIINNTSEPIRLEAYFEADTEFGEKYNLNSNVTIFPKTVSLKPAAKQDIRFRIKPSANLEQGEYKSYLTFKEIPAEIKTVPSNEKNSKEVSSKIKMITEVSVAVYGQNGDPIVKGNLSDVKLDYNGNSVLISASSLSEGNTSLKFSYNLKVLNSNVESIGLLGISAREGKKDLSISDQLGPNLKGKKAKIVVTDQNGKIYYNDVQTL